jgi:ATP-dependent protease ClpP protease subunit
MPAASARPWFRFDNKADDPTVADIHIIDFIGDWIDDLFKRNGFLDLGTTAREFADLLAKLPDSVNTIRVHINSPGGDVMAGVNIANALRDQQASKGRTVETYIDGIAASIASVIAMAGSKVFIADNALVMVHNPWSVAIGEAKDMRKSADVLDTVREQIIATYKWHTDLSDEEIVALMDAETWMTADEAIAKGFATDKVEGLKAAASISPKALTALKVPEQYKARVEAFIAKPEQPAPAPQPAAAADVLRACHESGLDLAFAQALLDGNVTAAEAATRITAEKDTRAKAKQRADAITAACAALKLPERASLYIASALSLDDVKKDLANLTAMLDKADIDTGLDPNHQQRSNARIDVTAVYAERNRPRTN